MGNAGNAANRGLSGPAAVNSAFVRPLPVRATPGPNKAQVPPSGLPGGPSAFIQGSDYTAETAWPTLNTASDASSNANSNSVTSINTDISLFHVCLGEHQRQCTRCRWKPMAC